MPFIEPENVTRMNELFSYANTVTDGMLGTMLVAIAFFVVLLSTIGTYGANKAFWFANVLTLLLTVPLGFVGIVSWWYVYLLLIMLGFTTYFVRKTVD